MVFSSTCDACLPRGGVGVVAVQLELMLVVDGAVSDPAIEGLVGYSLDNLDIFKECSGGSRVKYVLIFDDNVMISSIDWQSTYKFLVLVSQSS